MWIAEIAQPVPLHRAFDYEVPPALLERALVGARVRAPFGSRHLIGVLLSVREGEPKRALKSMESVLDPAPVLSLEMLDLARWISKRYAAPIGECLKALLPAFIKTLAAAAPAVAARALPEQSRERSLPAPFQLTAGQAEAVEALRERLGRGSFSAALLYGVPASGKTEVYARLMREAVEGGGQVLYLLPEISLTRPFFEEFSARADCSVTLWHSRLRLTERRATWEGLRAGTVQAVVGARSACLLPFRNLRLIVMDEEQDESYKQEGQPPFYHAREIVLERARRVGALAVLGSATPSLEAVAAAQAGAVELLRLSERVIHPHGPPRVDIIDKPRGREGCLSEELAERIRDRLARREQVILLVNRRGYSNFVICRKCGWVARCPSCQMAFIHHEAVPTEPTLRCHHCGRKKAVPPACGGCGAPALSFAGVGTQKIVAELKSKSPEARVLRMDRDTVGRKDEDFRLYERFKSGQADILVGTKLVAKGFHFPDVTLVGVVDADTMLDMPDFRAAERTVQLLLQAAGRSGRADKPGEVLIQTSRPDHYALQAAARGDYLRYARREISLRRELGYPPAAELVRLVLSGFSQAQVAQAADAAASLLRRRLGCDERPEGTAQPIPAGPPNASEADILGPAPAVHSKLRGRHRYQLLVKLGRGGRRFDAESAQALRASLPSSIRLQIDVDPYDLF